MRSNSLHFCMMSRAFEGKARQTGRRSARRAMLRGLSIVNITEDVSKYGAEQAISEEEALKKGMEEKVEGFEPLGGELEDFCAANGRRPKLPEQLSKFVEKGAEVYTKA